MQAERKDRIRAFAEALAPALKPHALGDLLADIDAGELPPALSVLHDIAILEEACDVRSEVEALADDLGIVLHR